MMQEIKDTTLAREMTDFCRQRTKRQSSHLKHPQLFKAVFGVVVAALMPSSSILNTKWVR